MILVGLNPAMNKTNIISGLDSAGMWPLDPTRVNGGQISASAGELDSVLTKEDLMVLMKNKPQAHRDTPISCDVQVKASRYIEITQGVTLTSENAFGLCREKSEHDASKSLTAQNAADRRAARDDLKEQEQRTDIPCMIVAQFSRRNCQSSKNVLWKASRT